MGLLRSNHGAGIPRKRLLNPDGRQLRGCSLAQRGENHNRAQATGEGESAFGHNLSLPGLNPILGGKSPRNRARKFAAIELQATTASPQLPCMVMRNCKIVLTPPVPFQEILAVSKNFFGQRAKRSLQEMHYAR